MKNKQILGSVLLMLVAIIWGTAFAFQRVGMDHIEPITFTAMRMTLAAGFIGIASVVINRKKASEENVDQIQQKKSAIIGGICCGCFLAFASIFQQWGIVYTTAGKAGFITALYIKPDRFIE